MFMQEKLLPEGVKHLPKHVVLPYGSSIRETSKRVDDDLIFIQTWGKNVHA